MAIKRPLQNLTTFSMSSMTDVIFLLLIFFMVTSTLVFPTALDVNLPQSGEQSSAKPVSEIYITADSLYYFVQDRNDTSASKPRGPLSLAQLGTDLQTVHKTDSLRPVAIYADTRVPYGKVVDAMDLAARLEVKTVLATKASQRVDAIPGMAVPDAPNAAKPLQ